jgi:hypothetical protein
MPSDQHKENLELTPDPNSPKELAKEAVAGKEMGGPGLGRGRVLAHQGAAAGTHPGEQAGVGPGIGDVQAAAQHHDGASTGVEGSGVGGRVPADGSLPCSRVLLGGHCPMLIPPRRPIQQQSETEENTPRQRRCGRGRRRHRSLARRQRAGRTSGRTARREPEHSAF